MKEGEGGANGREILAEGRAPPSIVPNRANTAGVSFCVSKRGGKGRGNTKIIGGVAS